MPKATQRSVVLCLAGQDAADYLQVKLYCVDVLFCAMKSKLTYRVMGSTPTHTVNFHCDEEDAVVITLFYSSHKIQTHIF